MLIELARILERGLGNSLSGDNSNNMPTDIPPPEALSMESKNLTKSAVTIKLMPGDGNIPGENQDVDMPYPLGATEIITAKVHKKAKNSAVAQYVYCITAFKSPN